MGELTHQERRSWGTTHLQSPALKGKKAGPVRVNSKVAPPLGLRQARLKHGASLSNQNLAWKNPLPSEALDSQSLGIGVAAVLSASRTFFVRHWLE